MIDTQKDVDVLMVARFMYDRNADTMDANDEAKDYYWDDPGVRNFWVGEAEAILSFVGFAEPA